MKQRKIYKAYCIVFVWALVIIKCWLRLSLVHSQVTYTVIIMDSDVDKMYRFCTSTFTFKVILCFQKSFFITRLCVCFLFVFFPSIDIASYVSFYQNLYLYYCSSNSFNRYLFLFSAIIYAVRTIGTFIGFLLASYTLKIFVDPKLSPNIDSNDPRWIGAWWIGIRIATIPRVSQ